MWGEVYFFLHALDQYTQMVSFLPRKQIKQYLIKHYSTAPYITFDGVWLTQQNLWGHINGSAYLNLYLPTLVPSVGLSFIYWSTIILANPKSDIFTTSEIDLLLLF